MIASGDAIQIGIRSRTHAITERQGCQTRRSLQEDQNLFGTAAQLHVNMNHTSMPHTHSRLSSRGS